jgi:hypothetical protein
LRKVSAKTGQLATSEGCGDHFAFGAVLYDSITTDVVPFGDGGRLPIEPFGQVMRADRIVSFHTAAIQGSITVRPAAANALASRDATAKSCAAAIAAI